MNGHVVKLLITVTLLLCCAIITSEYDQFCICIYTRCSVFTWLNATVFIILVSKLVQLLFETDRQLMLEYKLVILKLSIAPFKCGDY